jgi:Cof subfamily protein (haloacid dehalogenase superfamily)
MNIKLIVMDMDGTLLNAQGVISQANRKALIAAQDKGIHLGIASGRHPDGLAHFAKELQMERHGGYLIGANGALLVHYPDMTKLFHHTIDPSAINELFSFGLAHHVEVMAVHDHTIIDAIPESLMPLKQAYLTAHHLDPSTPPAAGLYGFVQDHRKNYPDIHFTHVYDEAFGAANKVCFAHEPEVMDTIIEPLQRSFGDRFTIMRTAPRWTELSLLGIDKGSALREVQDLLNLQADEVMAFGDGENDIPLFKACAYGVAMGNAMPKLKENAWAITASNNEDGIAQALVSFGVITSY